MRIARVLLWTSSAAMVALTFVWPYLVSANPADSRFEAIAIGTFWAFLAAVAWILVRRAAA